MSLPTEFSDGLLPRRWSLPLRYYLFELSLELVRSTIFPDLPSTHLPRRAAIARAKLESDINRLAETWPIVEVRNDGCEKYITMKNIEWKGYFFSSFAIWICRTLFPYLFKAGLYMTYVWQHWRMWYHMYFIWSIYITYIASIPIVAISQHLCWSFLRKKKKKKINDVRISSI